MTRDKMKNSKPQAFRLRTDICERLDKYSEKSMIPKTSIVEAALKEYLERVDSIEKITKK